MRPQTRVQAQMGSDDVARTLLRQLQVSGLWPAGAPRGSLGPGGAAHPYEAALVQRLVSAACYLPKESSDPSLAGQPMLEDRGPAELLLRQPGQPTRCCHIPVGDWACLAPMCLFYPGG